MCDELVLGGPRWDARLCSTACATDALFEVVRIEAAIDDAATATHDSPASAARTLLANARLLQRRQLLMRASLDWHDLDELAAPTRTPADVEDWLAELQ